jgi:selenide,water dikinase
LVFPTDENVLVGLDRADDAGVYKISDEIALIQTVDFFTPIVDNPYWFGQIAAANALSDVYAMGGTPKTALNLVAFPAKDLDLSVLRQIIQGGIDKLAEAGVVLIGGHSIEDEELKYGLSVTGIVHPARVLTKMNLKAGDRLVLTKPLGTGIINTAIKASMASEELTDKVTRLMASLNRDAVGVMSDFIISACTDVTGFGLLGHLGEVVRASEVSAEVDSSAVPLLPGAADLADSGVVPGGTERNLTAVERFTRFRQLERPQRLLLADAQTSGGLLITVEAPLADALLQALTDEGEQGAVIGRIVERDFSDGPTGAIDVG